MTSTREGRVTSRQTGADDAGFTPRSRSIQVGEFEVAIPGGIWVAIGDDWVKRDEVDSGQREGLSTSERDQLKALQREVKELRRANEILKSASAFFAQAALDRELKK